MNSEPVMGLSRYKKRMLAGLALSVFIMILGLLAVRFFLYPVLGVPFAIGGGFAGFYFLLYLLGEYEEDEADPRTLTKIANGHIEGLSIRHQHADSVSEKSEKSR